MGRVLALGTRYLVRLHDDRVRVVVNDGAVRIEPAAGAAGACRLEAGEGACTTPGFGAICRQHASGRVHRGTGRYRRGRLACDPAVAGLRISGSFPWRTPIVRWPLSSACRCRCCAIPAIGSCCAAEPENTGRTVTFAFSIGIRVKPRFSSPGTQRYVLAFRSLPSARLAHENRRRAGHGGGRRRAGGRPGHAQTPATAAPRVRANVPAGPLGAALAGFARQAQVLLSFDPALADGLQSPGLQGSHGVQEGLTHCWPAPPCRRIAARTVISNCGAPAPIGAGGGAGSGSDDRGLGPVYRRLDAVRQRPGAVAARYAAVDQRHHPAADGRPRHRQRARRHGERHRHERAAGRIGAPDLLLARLFHGYLSVRRRGQALEQPVPVRRRQPGSGHL